jgi:hypothetical protein
VRRLLASPELVARTITAVHQEDGAAGDTGSEEGDVIEAPRLPRAGGILRLLIERVDVAADGISITLHAAGIRSLVAELATQQAPAQAAFEPSLEAAE